MNFAKQAELIGFNNKTKYSKKHHQQRQKKNISIIYFQVRSDLNIIIIGHFYFNIYKVAFFRSFDRSF